MKILRKMLVLLLFLTLMIFNAAMAESNSHIKDSSDDSITEKLQSLDEKSRAASEINLKRGGDSAITLLIQDVVPWHTNSNALALSDLGIPYDVIKSSDIGTTDLSKYKFVMYASDQPTSYYKNVSANIGAIEEFVDHGGFLIGHCCDQGWHGGDWAAGLKILPGSAIIGHKNDYRQDINIIHPNDCVAQGLTDGQVSNWNLATHGYFTNLPAGATVVMVTGSDLPTHIAYNYGEGKVIATMQTVEWGYAIRDQPDLLYNEIRCANLYRIESMSSYEDLLRSQTLLIESFENLLKNTTLNSSMSYMFLNSFDDLARREQDGICSFEDLVSRQWTDICFLQQVELTKSFEDLLRREAIILSSNEDLLKRGFCKLNPGQKKELLGRFEARLKSEAALLKKFEDWLHYQQMIEENPKLYDTWMAFLSSFEDLIRRQSNLLDSFETLMKIDCNSTYIHLTKSADPLDVRGSNVTYTYNVTATDSGFDVKDIIVKDSLWGEVGTIPLLKAGTSREITATKFLSCADCDNCQCKVCNFATACGEVITVNGNFTVCVVNDAPNSDKCVIVSENSITSPINPDKKVGEVTSEQAPAIEATEASVKPLKGDDIPVTIYFRRHPGQCCEPEGFDVYVDGKYIGRGTGDSFSFTVSKGYHDIRVNDGVHDYQQSMIFQSGVPKIIYVNAE
jgi:hypothetical protein